MPDQKNTVPKVLFLNTLPKSGSVYLVNSLIKMLPGKDIRFGYVSANQGFPSDYIVKKQLDHIFNVSADIILIQEHIGCSWVNTRLLESSLSKMVLHIRDPRAALLSWVHHVENNLHLDITKLYNMEYKLPTNYTIRSFAERLDWDLHNLLPCHISWLKEWLDFYDNNCIIQVLLTTHSELKKDSSALFERVLSFYDIEGARPHLIPPPQEGTHHFRKGLSHEFFDVFSESQLAFANSIMDPNWFDRFDWPKLKDSM